MSTTAQPRARVPFALLAAFFLSGAAALIYQVLWTRRLGLVFGVTIQAASIVLACFMAGLAIGSVVAGRRAAGLTHPLRTFALVELGIGGLGLVTPALLAAVESIFIALAQWMPDSPVWSTSIRVVLSALVLIVPAALMGATYPIVLQATVRGQAGLRVGASLLYGVNTTGAIVGVMAGSLWLVPTIGIARSFLVAALINVGVAVLAVLVRPRAAITMPGEASAGASDRRPVAISPRARLLVLAVIAASGAVSLALEIIWFRVLVFFLRPTTYAFASMLATVLLGLAAGSLLATPLVNRRANWLAVLAVIELGVGLTGLVSAFAMVRSYDVMEWMWSWTWLAPPFDFVLPLIASAAVAILPTAVLLGAAFPIGLSLWTESAQRADPTAVGRPVGTLYAANVAGAIAGSIVGGFLLIPWLGAQRSLILVAAIPLMSGIALLWTSGVAARGLLSAAAVTIFGLGAFGIPDVLHDVVVRRYKGHAVLWHREDPQSTVTVVSRGSEQMLLIDGMHHASQGEGMVRGHERIGAIGLALHPGPRRILVVGFGAGATSGAASEAPGAQTQVVELSPSVLAAGPLFEISNRKVMRNPRVHFRVDDGRNFLLTTPQRFDIITADLLLPEMAGAANLYSVDYYRIARRALAPGGLMVQWIPPDNEHRYQLMLRTFIAAFPHVTTWGDGSIVIGSPDPIRFDAQAFERTLAHPRVLGLMREVGFGRAVDVTSAYLGSRLEAERYVGPGPLLEDDRPVIEYFLSMPRGGPGASTDALRGSPSAIVR